MQIGKVKDFVKLHKRLSILVTAGVVAAVGILIAIFVIWKGNSSQDETSYREYTVEKGNVTVGTTESGTVALEDETISLPIDVTISSVLVQSGATVKKGDPIFQLDMGSVSDGSSDIVEQLEEAKITLQSAINDKETELKEAEITYESNKYLATSAPITAALAEAEAAHDIENAQTTLTNDQKSLTEYQALQESWSTDNQKLTNLKKWRDDAESNKTNYETQLSDYEDDNDAVISTYDTLKSEVETDKQKYLAAKRGDTTVDGYDEDEWDDMLDEAQDAYDAYYDTVANTVITKQKELENKVAQYTAEYENYSSAYDDYKDTFDSKYKSSGSEISKTDLDEKVASLEASVKDDQYNLETAQKSAEISIMDAKETEETDLNTAENATSTYQLTVSQLKEAVTVAQDSYDTLQRQMDEINSALDNDGVVDSPCDGVVASISYTSRTDVTADDTIMTLSSDDYISVSVSISEDDITDISLGQDASITLSAYDGKTLDATVDSIEAEPARSGSSSVTYTVVVKSTEKVSDIGTVYDGMSGEATVIQHQVADVLYLNNRAVNFKDGVSSVLVKDQSGNTSDKTIQTGFSDGSSVEITSGLDEGDTVLVESSVSSK